MWCQMTIFRSALNEVFTIACKFCKMTVLKDPNRKILKSMSLTGKTERLYGKTLTVRIKNSYFKKGSKVSFAANS